ncbi:MAG: DMT family transporter [Acidimicrobiales bacterium]|nr:DMT family transporter [Acidimicrobiales bacterium]
MAGIHPPPHDRRAHLLAIASALLVTILWSSSWVLIRLGLDDEDLAPLTFAGLRYGLAAIALIVAVSAKRSRRQEIRRLDRRARVELVVLGVVFYALTQGAQFVAIDSQPAATTSLVLSLTPLFVGIAGARSLGERPTPRQFAGSGLIVAGAVVYFAGDLGATAIGLTAAIIGLAANVGGSLLGRTVNRTQSTSPIIVTTVSMSIGAALLVLAGLVVEGLPSITLRAGLIIAWLAIVNTAFAFTLWNLSLRRLSAIESAGINNTMLLQIAVLAWWFLDESPGWIGLVGVAVVSAGVFLTQLRRSPAPT